jgi:hypothetical protein
MSNNIIASPSCQEHCATKIPMLRRRITDIWREDLSGLEWCPAEVYRRIELSALMEDMKAASPEVRQRVRRTVDQGMPRAETVKTFDVS